MRVKNYKKEREKEKMKLIFFVVFTFLLDFTLDFRTHTHTFTFIKIILSLVEQTVFDKRTSAKKTTGVKVVASLGMRLLYPIL